MPKFNPQSLLVLMPQPNGLSGRRGLLGLEKQEENIFKSLTFDPPPAPTDYNYDVVL